MAHFDLVDRALDGELEALLRSMRAEGKSLDAMAAEFTERGIPTSRETVRKWCQLIGLPTHRVPAIANAGAEPAGRASAAGDSASPDGPSLHPAGGQIDEAIAS